MSKRFVALVGGILVMLVAVTFFVLATSSGDRAFWRDCEARYRDARTHLDSANIDAWSRGKDPISCGELRMLRSSSTAGSPH
jgi:hypothetical protein